MAAKANNKTSSSPSTMEELLARQGYQIKGFSKGMKVDAKFLRIDNNSAIFDVGGKSEGIVTDENFSEARKLIESLKPGDEVRAMVLEPESREGAVLLSLRNAAHEDLWDKIKNIFDNQETIDVIVKAVNTHGLVVAMGTESAFIPNSQLGKKAAAEGDKLVGSTLKVKIIDVDDSQNRIVLSERAVSEAAQIEKINRALSSIKPRDRFTGKAVTVTPFGVFVQILVPVGNKEVEVEGLVHVSELSWSKVEKPEDMVRVGDKIEVVALESDSDKLSLSARQAQKDPWEKAVEKYKPDDKVSGHVTKVSDFGVFVGIENGVEGLLHMTKIPPGTSLKVGQEVSCYIEELDPRERKISLGLVVTAAKPVGYK